MDGIAKLFDTSDFPARWLCGLWTAQHGWTHIVADLLIFGAYMAIPLLLAYFVRRREVPFRGVFILFTCFIFACGTVHLIEALIFWWPAYRLSGALKVVTAVVSWMTVFAMAPLVPHVLSLPARERALEERERAISHARLAVEASPSAMLLVDSRGRIVLVNTQAEALFGYSRSELIEEPIEMLVPERFRRRHPDYREHFLADPTSRPMGAGRDLFGLHKDGREVPIEIGLSPVRTDEGVAVLSSIIDITERKRSEQQLAHYAHELERSNEDLESFAYLASHDLQEPLRMVSNYCQLLGRRYADRLDDDGRTFVKHAVDGAQRMQRMIRDLLDYSRVRTDELTVTATDTRQLLERVRHDLATAIRDSGVELRVIEPLPVVNASPSLLCSVFMNLISNGIKYHRLPSPWVEVSAKVDDDAWVFTVRDNGIGIEPGQATRIFEPFVRLPTPTPHVGTGMGLTLCKRVVERHGGRIWVDARPGEGCEFHFTLARVVASQDAVEDRTVEEGTP